MARSITRKEKIERDLSEILGKGGDSNIVPLSIRLPRYLWLALYEKASRQGVGVAELVRSYLSYFLYPEVVKEYVGEQPKELNKKSLVHLRRAFDSYEKDVKKLLKDAEKKGKLLEVLMRRYEDNLSKIQDTKEDLVSGVVGLGDIKMKTPKTFNVDDVIKDISKKTSLASILRDKVWVDARGITFKVKKERGKREAKKKG